MSTATTSGAERRRASLSRRVDGDDLRPLRRRDDELAPPERRQRQPQVQPEDDEHDRADRQPVVACAVSDLQEDLLVADLPEPEPVGVELRERRDARENEEGRQEQGERGNRRGIAHSMPCDAAGGQSAAGGSRAQGIRDLAKPSTTLEDLA